MSRKVLTSEEISEKVANSLAKELEKTRVKYADDKFSNNDYVGSAKYYLDFFNVKNGATKNIKNLTLAINHATLALEGLMLFEEKIKSMPKEVWWVVSPRNRTPIKEEVFVEWKSDGNNAESPEDTLMATGSTSSEINHKLQNKRYRVAEDAYEVACFFELEEALSWRLRSLISLSKIDDKLLSSVIEAQRAYDFHTNKTNDKTDNEVAYGARERLYDEVVRDLFQT